MNAFIISDSEFNTKALGDIRSVVRQHLSEQGFAIEEVSVGRDDLKYCMGCFGCWVKKPGECVIADIIASINKSSMTSDTVFYLCPVVFGQFSANMKNVIDRWLPNMLPFFETRTDGSTMHPPRYKDYPRNVMIGYADDLDDADAQLFTDINMQHRNNSDTLIYRGDIATLREELNRLRLVRTGGQL